MTLMIYFTVDCIYRDIYLFFTFIHMLDFSFCLHYTCFFLQGILYCRPHQSKAARLQDKQKASLTLHFILNAVCQWTGQVWDFFWVVLHSRQSLPHYFTNTLLHNGWLKPVRFSSEQQGRELTSISFHCIKVSKNRQPLSIWGHL